jgi:putative membrane protein
MPFRASFIPCVSCALALAVLGCHGSEARPSQSAHARATDPLPTSVRDPSSFDASPQPMPKLDDAEIVAIIAATHGAAIEQSRLASVRASDTRVREYAEMLLEHRAQARHEQAELPFLPSASADSRSLQRHAADALKSLQQERGKEFDRAYLQVQLADQRDLLYALRDRLQPAAQQRQLRRYLEELAPQVESLLAKGERLQEELSGTRPLDVALRR